MASCRVIINVKDIFSYVWGIQVLGILQMERLLKSGKKFFTVQ